MPARDCSLLQNANAYLIESNHEIEMLRYGAYPLACLSTDSLGDKGHNEDGAPWWIGLNQDIYLGHLRKENKTKEFSPFLPVRNSRANIDVEVGRRLKVHMNIQN